MTQNLRSSRHKSGIVLAMLALCALCGCVSNGSSTFADALDVRSIAQKSALASEPLPLDVAATGVVDATGQAAAVPAASQTSTLQQSGAVNKNSLAAEEAGQLAALAPAEPAPQALLSQPATLSPQPVSASVATVSPVPGMPAAPVDPLELAAAQRAEAQYAAMSHGECKGGYGPKPKMVNAMRIDPAHRYYMEMRLRHTPPLPVGHVYIAYGRIGPDGEPLDEKLVMLAPVGGYAGATLAAAAPVTGVLTPYGDDCILRPVAAYRVSLSAQNYEKLLARIVKAQQDKPRYALWNYNCNHFMSDLALSVGILPPENPYTPSLEYFYAMMDRNEGRKVARSAASDTAELASAKFGNHN